MKPLYITACLLAALGYGTHAQEVGVVENTAPAGTEAQAENQPLTVSISRDDSFAEQDCDFHINFQSPVINEAEIETASTENIYTFTFNSNGQPVPHQAEWLSASCLSLKITEKTPAMDSVTLRVEPGVRSIDGKVHEGKSVSLPCSNGIDVLHSYSDDSHEVVILGSEYEKDDALLQERVDSLYFLYKGNKIPARARQATVGDALKHWEVYRSAFRWEMANSKKEQEKLREMDPATPLPHTWICDVPLYPDEGEEVELILPDTYAYRYVSYSEFNFNFKNQILYRLSSKTPDFILTHESTGNGGFNIILTFTTPTPVDDMGALMQHLEWTIRDRDHNDWDTPVWKDGELSTVLNGKRISLRVDEEATRQHCKTYTRTDGSTCTGSCRIVLNATTEDPECRYSIICSGKYPSIHGQMSKKDLYDATPIGPKTPYILSDVFSGQMLSHGSTTINVEYDHIKNGQVRLHRMDSSASNVAKLLTAYDMWYKPGRYENNFTDADSDKNRRHSTGRVNDMQVVPTELLPGVLQTVNCPLSGPKGEVSINIAEQFNGAPAKGVYFVEIAAESRYKRDNDAPIYNQGLVQVTDLGVLWKLNGKQIFAWGYHLQDGKEVQQGKLRLLDAKGKVLSEADMTAGIAQTDFPADTQFVQLCTADDSVMVVYNKYKQESEANINWSDNSLAENGIPAEEMSHGLVYLFSDRSLYRPGETAHIKGMVRWVRDNELYTPEIQEIKAKIYQSGELVAEESITPQPNGSFTLDFTPKKVGRHHIQLNVVYKGDADNTSPDRATLLKHNIDFDSWLAESTLDSSRNASLILAVQEYRRNEFEVKSSLNVDAEQQQITVNAKATNFTTTPVAHAETDWTLRFYRRNFYPRGWKEYYFGDFRHDTWCHFYAYYMDDETAGESLQDVERESGTLDARGEETRIFEFPESDEPAMGYMMLTSTATVTNGNRQSISSSQKKVYYPTEVMVGIKTPETLLKVGQSAPISLVALTPEGEPWSGTPLQGSIRAVRTSHKAYRYGSSAIESVHNVKEEEQVWEQPVTFGSTPAEIEFCPQQAGEYTIFAECTDTKGKKTESVITRYVWGDDESPWYYHHNTGLSLVTDKTLYQVGDTAHILVQTPVDAEVLVTVERDKVLRHYKRTITVNNPVIEVPIEAGDAPVVYVGVSLVQNADKRRKDGAPLLKMGVCQLNIEAADKKLDVALQAPTEHLLPEDACTVSGVVKDAAGNPVPQAEVTLYAEDEGALQVRGYTLPHPHTYFYSAEGRPQNIITQSALGQLITEDMSERYMGNKGVFVGGGDGGTRGGSSAISSDEDAMRLRENFTPCALWLDNVRTDENGCFSATFSNPDTLTRYRLMAVAATEDKFGSAKTSYHVTKPVMLEPIAPMGATEGDLLHLPVTVSMLPNQLEQAANGAAVEWKVRLSGTNVQLPEPEKTVSLTGKEPVTITFPVQMSKTGQAELTWSVQAADPAATGILARCKDAVKLSFEVIPPTPFLRERIVRRVEAGQTVKVNNLVTTPYRMGSPMEVTVSPSPLAQVGNQLHYLFTYPYGCSEQLCSTVIPWLVQDSLSKVGIQYPTENSRNEVLQKTFAKLNSRCLAPGQYSYWDNGESACEYSPYVVMVQHMAQQLCQQSLPGCSSYYIERQYRHLASTMLPQDEKAAPNLLSMYVLARAGKLSKEQITAAYERLVSTNDASPARRWALALCALMCQHDMAESLKNEAEQLEAQQANTAYYEHSALPPLEFLKLMYAIKKNPKAEETAMLLLAKLQEHKFYSTWSNGWMCLCVHDFLCQPEDNDNVAGSVNGAPFSTKQPLRLKLATGTEDTLTIEGTNAYICGYAEGHTAAEQPLQAIDNGLNIRRSYEKLMPDGSWKPTATFELGDVVRVSLNVIPSNNPANNTLRYMALEDRLPAVFEAVNPALLSQALPPGIDEETARHWWSFSSYIDNKEYLKDRVRFFASYLNNEGLKAQYIVRVVRRGKATAPATKAELMYMPQVHGLSIPQQLEVK